MPDLTFTKYGPGTIGPSDKPTDDYCQKMKIGDTIHGKFTKMRNPLLHRKLFALLNLGFEYWEPGEINSKYGVPEKNFERFRKDCIILAGYFHIVIRLDGTAKPEHDSISFANMDQDTFEKLYQAVLTVLIKRIPLMAGIGEDEVNRLVDKYLQFA